MDWEFFFEVLVGGLLSGIMYSLVAIGFVLIYKTSGVLNFAQGSLVLLAALTFVSLLEKGLPFWLAIVRHPGADGGDRRGRSSARYCVRWSINRPSLCSWPRSGCPTSSRGWRSSRGAPQVHGLDLGIEDTPLELAGVLISKFDVFAALVAGSMVGALTLFFRYTRIGLAFRSVADDQFAALAIGLDLERIWAIVWTAAGVVALVAGLLWGARLGVQFSLSLVVLKALPVLVLGGFDSIAGAIVGGLIVGAVEKLAEVYIGPFFGGGIEGWIAYVAALGFLLVRPAGLFGVRLVERV